MGGKKISKWIAGILAGIMMVSAIPALPVQAAESYTEVYAYELEKVKEQILNSEEAEGYENGAVTFPGNGTAVNVGGELVYHLFRQGSTDKEQTVTVFTQDLTAAYNKDYEVVVDGQAVNGKANVLLDGKGATYDVYLEEGTSSQETVSEEDGEEQGIDLEQVKEEASSSFDLTFVPGEQVKELRVRAKVPVKAVGNKEFQFVIYECTNDLEQGAFTTSVITLAETREVEEAAVALVEGSEEVVDGYVTVLVERTGNTNGYTSYDVRSSDGTAVNGEDYVLSSAQLLFSPGVSKQRLHIPLVSAETEEEKTFTLKTDESETEINYTTTSRGAAKSFTKTRGVIDIDMSEFVWSEETSAVGSTTFEEEQGKDRYKFGFHSVAGGGKQRNASIRTAQKYDFTGIKSIKFSGSYAVGTVAGDHLNVYVSNDDYALNEAKLGNLSGSGARYSIYDLTGQGLHEFAIDKKGEFNLYMTAEQHSGAGWIYYYLYNQDFDGGDKGHVALVMKPYTVEGVTPAAVNGGNPASDVKLTLSTDSSVTGEKIEGYRDESFRISYKQLDETAKYVGYQLVDSQNAVYHTEYTESPVFVLKSEIIEKYSDKFTDNTIRVRPLFEHEQAVVNVLKQDFSVIEADTLSAVITIDAETKKASAVYKDGNTEIATVTWTADYAMRSKVVFKVKENPDYTGDYHFTAFKIVSGSSSTAPLSNPVYHSTTSDEWVLEIADEYYEITPLITNRNARLLLNVTGADKGTFAYEPENNQESSYTVEEYDGKYDTNDIVIFEAIPDDGYRAKWSYCDIYSGQTKIYYGQIFYYRVQAAMLLTDNHVSLEFEKCDAGKDYSVVADVYMQGGNLLHEPEKDSTEYAPLAGAKVSLDKTAKETGENGATEAFTLNARPGETYTALVIGNNRQYIQDVTVPEDGGDSIRQKMYLSYYYEGPRVSKMQYYAYDGTIQHGDTIYLSGTSDSVILAAEIEKAGQEVTDVIYKLKDSEGQLRIPEVTAERNGNEYRWAAPLGIQAVEGDQIWIELVKREYDENGDVVSQISYGEVNTGYSIVVAEFSNMKYLPDTGVDQDIEGVPFFGSMYCMLGAAGFTLPTFTTSKVGGVTYLNIGLNYGGEYNFYHQAGESGFSLANTWNDYVDNMKSGLKAVTSKWNGDTSKVASQSLKRKGLSFNVMVAAQLALYDIVNEETGNSDLVVVGSWMSFGFSGAYSYTYPFFVWYIPMFVNLKISGDFAETVQLSAKEANGYVALQDMHDPTKSTYMSENDLGFSVAFSGLIGAGVNGVADVAGGMTGSLTFDWVDWSWGSIVLSGTADIKLEVLILGGTFNIDVGSLEILNTNPYLTAEEKGEEIQESLLNNKLSVLKMKPISSYNQSLNVTSLTGLRMAGQMSDVFIFDAYDFSRPQMYEMGNDQYMVVATVDSTLVSGLDVSDTEMTGEKTAVLAYAVYNTATGSYITDDEGKIFKSLEPIDKTLGSSINFHPSITKIGETGKYLIAWNSVLYGEQRENITLADCRTLIKAAVYDAEKDQIIGYKSIVTEDADGQLFTNTVIDTQYDEVNKEVVVLYRAMNTTGLGKDSKLIDYANSGSSLMCTSIRLETDIETDQAAEFTESVEIVSGGKEDGRYNVIKTADLAIMNGQPYVTYQMTRGEQANLISTGEEGSTNHIYVASLVHTESGYGVEDSKEVTKGLSDGYNADPQLLSYQMDGKIYNVLMWKQENCMATVDPVEFLNSSDLLFGTAPDENGQNGVDPTYVGEGTANILNKHAGGMGDYQIIQGADGRIYSIWTEGYADENTGVTGTHVMMAALEKAADDCGDEYVSWGVGSEVFTTSDYKYVRAMSPIVDKNGVLHMLYKETAIGGNAEGYNSIVMKKVPLTQKALTNTELQVSEAYPKAGQTLTISGYVKNESVFATEKQTLMLYANGIDTGERVEIPALRSGITNEFVFNYTVPDDYSGKEEIVFSVGTAGKGARTSTREMLQETTLSGANWEVSYLDFEQLTYLDSEDTEGNVSFNVTAGIKNTGNDIADESTFVLSNIYSGKNASGEDTIIETVFGSCDVPVIKPDNSQEITFQVDIPVSYFMENEMHLASIAGAIYTGYNPDNTEEQTMVAGFTDYVQAEEEPEAVVLSMASSKKVGSGQKLLLDTAIEPLTAQANTKLMYKSSDTSIATVDENGIITGVKEGKCTITVTTENGLEKTIVIEVTKNAAAEDDEKHDSGTLPDNNDNNEKNKGTDTGDHSPILLMTILLIVSLAVIVGIVVVKKRRK